MTETLPYELKKGDAQLSSELSSQLLDSSSENLEAVSLSEMNKGSCCSVIGSATSLECQDMGLILSRAQWVLVLPQLWLGSDPCPGNPMCCKVAKNEKKKTQIKLMEDVISHHVCMACKGFHGMSEALHGLTCLQSVPLKKKK